MQDCLGAIAVCEGSYEQSQSYTGQGQVINEINPVLSCLKSGERNDVWYVITVQSDGLLLFTITPNNYTPGSAPPDGDDYDWALFNVSNHECTDIKSIESLEVSCNYDAIRGPTGANNLGTDPCQPPVPVLEGETYVLNISNFSSSQSGYMLDFTESTAGIYDTQKPFMVEILPINCFDTIITIKFNEFILCSTVTITDFELTGPGGIYSLNSITAPGCTNGGHHDREFTINTDSIFIDGNYELHLIGEVSDLCANPSDPGIVTFAIIGNRPAPLVATANSPCLGTTMQLDATHYTTATYQWTGPSEFTSSLQSPSIPNVSTNANGLYHVTATLSIDCILTSSVFVTINPSPPAGAKTIFHD